MAMVYAQSTSEIQQTVISMQPDIEFSCQGGQDCSTANVCGLQFHPLPIDNGYSNGPEYLNATINGSSMFEITEKLQQTTNGASTIPTSTCQMDSVEELSYVPGLSDILNTPFQDTARKRQRQDESEQNVSDDISFVMEQHALESGVKGLSWQAFLVDSWFPMCDSALQEITHEDVANGCIVDADKGFNYSTWDESFVCQKKNHFQISVQFKLLKLPKYIKICNEIQPISNFALHLYGIKFEALDSIIQVEQSRTDRTKLAYEAISLDFPTVPDQVLKATACRLHFSETTANNMRKRGKPNPDQRYFALVVAIHANTMSHNYPIVAYVSERIIVRASNPGQFDNEGDSIWLRGNSGESVFYHGKVGINTETPDESLTVIGNVQVTGQILQPSDRRLKTNIKKMNTQTMLDNISQMTLYSYSFRENAFNSNEISNKREEVGLLAQEVEIILPDAVQKMDFQGRNDVRLLNKDRVLMECLGAVQQLIREKNKKRMNSIINLIFIIVLGVTFAFIHSLL